jgi:hypothetical protein
VKVALDDATGWIYDQAGLLIVGVRRDERRFIGAEILPEDCGDELTVPGDVLDRFGRFVSHV